MQNFLKIFSIRKIQNNLKESFQKFPIPFISSILIFGILEFLILKGFALPQPTLNFLLKLSLTLIFIFFLGVGVKFFLSSQKIFSGIKKFFLEITPIILGIIFFFNFEENLFNNFFFEEFIYIFITILGALSFLFISKFLIIKNKNFFKNFSGEYKNEKYFSFFNEKILKIGLSVFLGFALMLLGFIAIWSIFSLFEIGNFFDEGKIFGSWAAFALSFFAPIYFLGTQSKGEKNNLFEKLGENKFYNFFVKFLALPAIIVYFLILYAYSAKVLLNFQNWPEGIISWLIIFFSLFGYFFYLFSFSLEKKSVLVKNFRKYFPLAVLFQLPMFFYAIFLRINQYDFTINRYLLLAFGFYLLVISLYFIFSKNKKLMHIFSFLFGFILFISLSGNFSVYKFPENRQLDLLEKNLIEAKILVDGKIILPEEDLSKKFATEIYHKVDYLCDFHGCDILGKIIPEVLEEIKKDDFEKWEKNRQDEIERFSKAIEEHGDEVERTEINKRNLEREKNEKYIGINSWEYKDKIVKKLKVENYFYKSSEKAPYIRVNLKNDENVGFYEVKGWDYFVKIYDAQDFQYFSNTGKADYSQEFKEKYKNTFFAVYYPNELKLSILKGENEVENFYLSDDFKKFYNEKKDFIKKWGYIEIEKSLTLEKIGEKFEVKILLNNFNIKNLDFLGEKEQNFYGYVDGSVLIKEK